VGIDRTTGLGVVRIDDDLPAATFDAVDPPVGDVAVATALDPGSPTTAPPASTVYAGTVVATGQAPTGSGSVPGFSATAVDAPLDRRDLGCALLDGSGHVAGILEATDGTGRDALAYFLPAQLVLGVTRQLVTSGTVEHGWLGLGSIDSAAPGGAAVTPSAGDGAAVAFVDPDSPAASVGLAAGDVIVDMNGEPVHSTAELRSMLYPEPPGSSMAVTFERAGVTRTVPVVLGEPEAADAGDDSSP
jgi:serine protease Do